MKERAKRWGGDITGNKKASSSRSRTTQRPDRELYRVGGRKEAPAPQNVEERRGERGVKRRKSRSKTPEESERVKDPDKERRRHRKRSTSGERRRSGSRSRKHREHRSERRHGEKDRDGDRHRDRGRERGNDKSSDKKDHTSDKPRERRHRSPLAKRRDDSDTEMDKSSRKRRKVEERASPDLIDEIIGPAPPPPPARARGRGTTSGSSAMDARFSEKYDPTMDVQPDSDDGDDWDNAAEAYRDRQKWKALGAERLRSAGFEEDFITAWENNDTKNTANIKWAKGGVREWDRGKVVEEDTGEVSVRASWAKGEGQEGRLGGWDEGRLNEGRLNEGRLNEGRLNEGRLNGWDEGRLNGGGEDYY